MPIELRDLALVGAHSRILSRSVVLLVMQHDILSEPGFDLRRLCRIGMAITSPTTAKLWSGKAGSAPSSAVRPSRWRSVTVITLHNCKLLELGADEAAPTIARR